MASTGFASCMAICALLAAAPAQSTSHARLDAGWMDYDAREIAPSGFVLNRERGDLWATGLSMGSDEAWGSWSAMASRNQGNLQYTGISQFGIPLQTTTALKIDRIALGWEPPWEPEAWRITLRPSIELSRQFIDRNVHASARSTPLDERLDTTDVAIGLQLQLRLDDRWNATLVAKAMRPLRQRLEVDTFGTYDKFVLAPRARTSRLIAIGVSREIANHWRVGIRVLQEHRHYGASPSREISRNGVVVGAANYPGSRQHVDGASVHIDYLF